ncbi:MAG: cadmium-translocating P-type ATPase [Candidatus Riflebacteria bacterium GWC2_50_8]|nr:MAG: cadmium-translocating P-type ATPase [Candidatus Riflebacteria bacterium GWC2_50_8]
MDKEEKDYNHSVGLNRLLQIKLANSIFAVIFLVAGIVYEIVFQQHQISQLIIAIGAISVALPIFVSGLRGVLDREGRFMTEQLVSLAILGSMIEGDFIVATIIPVIMVFGHLLEEKSIMGIEEAISSLKKLHSRHARIRQDGIETMIEPEELKLDDLVICYPGEIIPADGLVCEGDSLVNQAPITGESVPVEVFTGTTVYAGTVNLSGKITIRVDHLNSDTLLNKIVGLLKEAERSKAPIIKLVEKYVSLYFPFVIMVAATTLFVTSDIGRAIAILIISCPCALILASPTAMIAALVRSSRHGIMIKNTAFLELLAEVDTLIFDKTGTVTYGKLEIEEILTQNCCSRQQLLEHAAFCASGSLHPVSTAIRNYAHEHKIKITIPTSHKEMHGRGVIAESATERFYLGKLSWICETIGINAEQDQLQNGSTSVWIANQQKLLGEITFADKPRPEMHEAIASCRKLGIKNVYLLTGDKKEIGDRIGEFLGIDGTLSQCLPEDKLNFVNQKKAEGCKVLFVGDGINDALALKASDVGVAIARGGSDIAIQNSDITLNSDSLLNLPKMLRLSALTHATINQNILIGTSFSLFMIGLAALGIITPVVGAIAHNLGSVFVVLNSARMLKKEE